ncbi:MAG: cytochrome c biogenesis protein CcdA [Caldisericia bacterium]|nr:cytochrome c biogenesis protein CcdA [Caldisericia bacterium]MDD5688999.1 cytochrome c biogenesis protein CcdA [Caldisericia bacterium]
MSQLLITLTKAISSSSYLAIFASLIWGFLSVLMSPCHLASIPLIIGFIGGQKDLTTKKAFQTSLIFAIGIFVSVTLIGFITASLGRLLGDIGIYGNIIIALIFMLVGLSLMDILPLNWGSIQIKKSKKSHWIQALILGFVFGIGLGPCTFAFMAPILGVIFQVATARLYFSIILLLLFAIGHISVLVLAGTFTEVVQRYLKWSEKSSGVKIVRTICGALVFLGGVYLILKAFAIV